MADRKLTPFSYTLLVLVGRGGAGPHDVVRMMRQGRVYWAAAESGYYAELKRLAADGYLAAERGPGRTTERTHYRLTERGLEALRRWAAEPCPLPRIQNEAVVRVLGADLIGAGPVLQGLRGLRAELDDTDARLDAAEANIAALPHRATELRLVHRLGRAVVRVHREWLDEVERELGAPAAATPAGPS